MKRLLTSIDQFGAEQKLQIHPQTKVQRSTFGGIMTLILYGTSFSYFLYEFIDWQKNNKLPKITSFQKEIDHRETVQTSGRFLEITQYPSEQSTIDPFDPQNLILYPIIFKLEGNFDFNNMVNSQFESVILQNGQKQNKFYLENLEMKGSPASGGYSTDFVDYVIILIYCNPQTELGGLKCANETVITQFNQQLNYINLVFHTSQFDTRTQKLYKIPKSQKALIMLDSVTLYQFSFEVVNLQTDDGVLFTNMQNYTYASDFSFASQQVAKTYVKEIYHVDGVLSAYITLGQIKQEVLVEYPKISEILANTGSIIAWILQISFIVYKYNEVICSDKTIREVIKIYFPDFDNLIIKKNVFGKFISANIDNQNYDSSKVQQLFQQLGSLAEQKVNFINLQFEVARLQQLVTEALGLGDVKIKLTQVKNIEALVESQGCRIQLNNNSQIIKILPQNLSIYPLTENHDFQSINQIKNCQYDLIDSTIGLLLQKDYKKQISDPPHQNGIESNIYPQEELKAESISQMNSVH